LLTDCLLLKLLLIKRTEKTSYALNHCVFPGGVFDPIEDQSAKWINFFKSFGVTDEQLKMCRHNQDSPRPEFLSGASNEKIEIDLSVEEFRSKTNAKLHRSEHWNQHQSQLIIKFERDDGQVHPLDPTKL